MNQVGTASDANSKIRTIQQKARAKSHDQRIDQFRNEEITSETDLALESFDDGFKAGYGAGYAAAMTSVRSMLKLRLGELDSAILSKWP